MGIKNSFIIAKSNVLSIFKKLIINRKVLRVYTLLFIPETVVRHAKKDRLNIDKK